MRKGEATRARILAEAGRQAAVRGLSAVSLNDVAEAVGLSKSGLFKHFDSKEAMHHALLSETGQNFFAFVWTDAAEPLPAGRERIERVFDRWMDWTMVENASSGCLILAASVELDDQPGPLRDLVKAQLQRWHARLAQEMQALRDPPLSLEEARFGVFQLQAYILGFSQSARFLDQDDARAVARGAFHALLDRLSAKAA